MWGRHGGVGGFLFEFVFVLAFCPCPSPPLLSSSLSVLSGSYYAAGSNVKVHDAMALVAVLWLNSVQSRPRPDMPRRQKKETDSAGNNDALTLLRLQQQVLQLTAAKAALEDVQKLVHESPRSL